MGIFSKSSDKNDESEKWKHKYLDLVDVQEAEEKAYKLSQDLLCKTVIRLSIIASESDPQLESYFQRIRDLIKKGFNFQQLKNELESLTSALTRLDVGKQDKRDSDNDGAIHLFIEFLRRRYSSDGQQHDLDLLQKSYLSNGDKEQLFAAIMQFISDHSQTRTEEAASIQSEQPLPSQAERTEHLAVIKAQLIRLLDNIEIPDDFIQKTEDLKQQLDEHEAPAPFDALWDNLATLLIEINDKNKSKQQEIDKFLTHITEQLTELGLTITDSGIALMDASLSRSQLDQSVSEQMNDLQNRSSNATQLEPLKQVISLHIAKITKEIQDHKQKEATQREKYQRQLDELSQKIKVMEQETGELQSKLITAKNNAQRDALTDLPNRFAYDDRLKMEMGRWQRYHTPLCLAVMDIDYFKKINDQYGHQTGDRVLEHVAGLFAKNIRRADFVARFGGEEFVMLLPHTNKHSALKVTDKLRTLVEQNRLQNQGAAISISISCGITQFIKGDTHESAFKRADDALYRAKESGRNQCCVD